MRLVRPVADDQGFTAAIQAADRNAEQFFSGFGASERQARPRGSPTLDPFCGDRRKQSGLLI